MTNIYRHVRTTGRAMAAIGVAALAGIGLSNALPSDTAVAEQPARAHGPSIMRYTGVNMAGGEFGNVLTGRHGFQYMYPEARDVAPFVAYGMNTVRLPVRWERLQPVPGGALNPRELQLVDRSIGAMGGVKLIVLDIHNYAGHAGVKLGTPGLPVTALADLWSKLARHYGKNQKVAFGLMNEPSGLSPLVWRDAAERAIKAVRKTGARNLVLVPGTLWTGAHSWNRGGPMSNAALFADFSDPGGNFAIEMHQYLDSDSSGTKSTCVDADAVERRMTFATNWLRDRGFRGFLGEFGAASNPACLASLEALLKHMKANDDVWLGWTYWAAGRWWGKYPMSIQPQRKVAKPQAFILNQYLAD